MGIFIIWLILSFGIGLIGGKRKIGFLMAFLLSLIFTPVIGFFAAITSKTNKSIMEDQKHQEQMNALKSISSSNLSYADEIEKLQNLLKEGVISQEDYEREKSKLDTLK